MSTGYFWLGQTQCLAVSATMWYRQILADTEASNSSHICHLLLNQWHRPICRLRCYQKVGGEHVADPSKVTDPDTYTFTNRFPLVAQSFEQVWPNRSKTSGFESTGEHTGQQKTLGAPRTGKRYSGHGRKEKHALPWVRNRSQLLLIILQSLLHMCGEGSQAKMLIVHHLDLTNAFSLKDTRCWLPSVLSMPDLF